MLLLLPFPLLTHPLTTTSRLLFPTGSHSYRRALSQHSLLSSREFTEGFGIDREGVMSENTLLGGQPNYTKEGGRSATTLDVHLLTHPPNLTQVG